MLRMNLPKWRLTSAQSLLEKSVKNKLSVSVSWQQQSPWLRKQRLHLTP